MHNFVSKTYAQKRRTDVREEGVEIHLLIISLIIMWYLVPFTLSFLKNMPFSFGPTGYKFKTASQLFFYGGLVSRTGNGDPLGLILVIFWMLTATITNAGIPHSFTLFQLPCQKTAAEASRLS